MPEGARDALLRGVIVRLSSHHTGNFMFHPRLQIPICRNIVPELALGKGDDDVAAETIDAINTGKRNSNSKSRTWLREWLLKERVRYYH
jgi:hypothetical protein